MSAREPEKKDKKKTSRPIGRQAGSETARERYRVGDRKRRVGTVRKAEQTCDVPGALIAVLVGLSV